ncbi:Uncharacterized protein ABC855_g4 [[Candida] zeylanoides]
MSDSERPAHSPRCVRDGGSPQVGSQGAPATSVKPRLKRNKSKPLLRRSTSKGGNAHYKLVYSVDDDVGDDIVEEVALAPHRSASREDAARGNPRDRDYLEGYNDALKQVRRGREERRDGSAGPSGASGDAEGDFAEPADARRPIDAIDEDADAEAAETAEAEPAAAGGGTASGDDSDSASVSSLESLSLRERQNAINSTHPFGIKIWKPSLYKKKRSVAARAEEDIHDYELREPTYRIFWGVLVCNAVWSATFGLALYMLCLFGCVLVFICSGFGCHRQSRPYVKSLYAVAQYWLMPFGIFVLLNQDKNYREEDQFDGRSLVEFQRWREQEEGRLFFAPPRRLTMSDSSGRPSAVKDGQGRSWNARYHGLGDEAIDDAVDGTDGADGADGVDDIKKRFFGRGSWSSGRFMFYVYFYLILQPILYLLVVLCWLFVFTIPMAKIISTICDHLRRHPLALHFEAEKKYYDSQASEGFQRRRKHQSIIMCTYRCCGFHYYKYTIDGTNIFFINLLATVVFVIFDFYALREWMGWRSWVTDPTFVFGTCLLSIIPLAYFIGQAVASISAQSSMGVGAVINAFFSTVVEIFLYSVALNQSKGKLVEGSLIGSILGGVLLLPGLSMCGGALKRKTQRYNPRSAGVSSTMLLFAMVIMFAPSMFYQIYGAYEIRCSSCVDAWVAPAAVVGQVVGQVAESPSDCTKCRFIQPQLKLDALYDQIIKPFSMIVAVALFIAYVCGLYFTLRTHASLIWATNLHEASVAQKKEELNFSHRSPSVLSLEAPKRPVVPSASSSASGALSSELGRLPTRLNQPAKAQAISTAQSTQPQPSQPQSTQPQPSQPQSTQPQPSQPSPAQPVVAVDEEEEVGGHDAPNWSRQKSTVILLGATLAYAIIAEILVNCVDAVLVNFPIDPKFLGLTVFALVPNTTEFLNAISFAVSGNVALSMEIGSAYALQVVLIQIPSLVMYTIYMNFGEVDKLFPLVFPRWDIIATLMSIFLFTYIYAEGKSNYFKGVILILIYFVVLIGFWFNDKIESMESYGMGMGGGGGHNGYGGFVTWG